MKGHSISGIKRFLTKCLQFVSVFILFFSGLSVVTRAYTERELEYVVEDNSITITGYLGTGENVTVPSQIAGTPVSRIRSGSFQAGTLKEVLIPDTVMEIENGAISAGIKCTIYDPEEKGTAAGSPEAEAEKQEETNQVITGSSDSVDKPSISVETFGTEENATYGDSGLDTGSLELSENPEPEKPGRGSYRILFISLIIAVGSGIIATVFLSAWKKKKTRE